MIEVPTTAIELAKRFEGFHRVPKNDLGRAYPYVCPAGYWTIGYGHLSIRSIRRSRRLKPRAIWRATSNRHLPAHCATVRRWLPSRKVDSQPSWTSFNLNGAGRLQDLALRRRINQRDWVAAAGVRRARWIYGGGKVLPGLVTRRAAKPAYWRYDDRQTRNLVYTCERTSRTKLSRFPIQSSSDSWMIGSRAWRAFFCSRCPLACVDQVPRF